MEWREEAADLPDPAVGWGAALVFASVFPSAGAMLGPDIVRAYVFWLGLLAVVLGVIASIATVYERCARSSRPRRPHPARDAADGG